MRKRRALIVGAGNMGRAWGANLQACDEVEIAGWVDLYPSAATSAAAALGMPNLYVESDLSHAIQTTAPDFVVDVTVPEAHHDVTIEALNHGLPVLGEKPMAESMARARAMVAASERSGKLYMVSQSRRYNAALRAFRDLIDLNTGPIGILNSDFYIGAHFGGFRDEMASPLILDMAIHTFDAARYLSGADPVSVYCEEFNPPWSWYRGNASATAIFEMTGGLRYTYRGSWCGEGRATAWESEWRAVGPHGTATWDGEGAPLAEIVVDTSALVSNVRRVVGSVPASTARDGIAGSLHEFLQALETGSIPNGECHDNIKSLAMVLAAIASARAGKRVAVEL